MGIVPGPVMTRVLLLDGPRTLLRARLAQSPRDPRAVETLAEGLALWAGRSVRAVLAADGAGVFCATRPWRDTLDALERVPLVDVRCVDHDVVPAEPVAGAALGEFGDLRALLRRLMAR
jgi:hypothetical protein